MGNDYCLVISASQRADVTGHIAPRTTRQLEFGALAIPLTAPLRKVDTSRPSHRVATNLGNCPRTTGSVHEQQGVSTDNREVSTGGNVARVRVTINR